MVASAPVTIQSPPPRNRAAAMTESSVSHSSVVALGPMSIWHQGGAVSLVRRPGRDGIRKMDRLVSWQAGNVAQSGKCLAAH